MSIIAHIKKNLALYSLILIFGFIFFYKLDYNTLQSWDEAWYASIAREMTRTGDFMRMMWNGNPYYDHPPMGFWLMAISYKVFGVNEFSTRFPSALLGLLSIVLIYKTGVELFGKKIVGFAAAMILGTSVWYVLRVRSGNLESVFVFFYILTIYSAIKASSNFKWFPIVGMSFGSLILSKTLIGISALPLILYLNFFQLRNLKKNILWIFLGVVSFGFVVYPWYSFHLKTYPDFYQYHFFHKGTRDKTIASYFKLMLDQPLFYIHMGVRKWYKLWYAGIILSFVNPLLLFLLKNKLKNNERFKRVGIYLFLLIWNLSVLYPFLTSKETELWHLVPTYLPIALIIAGSFFDFGSLVFAAKKIFPVIFTIIIVAISSSQILIFRKEVYPQIKYDTDQVDISRRLTKYNEKIYLDIDYLPVAIFYSGKHIDTLVYESTGEKTFASLFEQNDGKVIGVTKNWVVEDLQKKYFPLKILERNSSYTILTKL